MEMTLTYWRDNQFGSGDGTETLKQDFSGLDPEIIPEFMGDTLKLSIQVVDGPDDLDEWVTLYLDFGSDEQFDESVGELGDDLVRMLSPDKEEAPELLPEG